MFYSIKGILVHKEAEFAVVECGGVGFKCFTTLNTQKTLPAVGEKVMLYTYLNVKEDALDLFGFSTQNELNCYKMLTSSYSNRIEKYCSSAWSTTIEF